MQEAAATAVLQEAAAAAVLQEAAAAAVLQEAAAMQEAAAARIKASSERLSRKAEYVAMHEKGAADHCRATGKPVVISAAGIAVVAREPAPAYNKKDIRAFFGALTP